MDDLHARDKKQTSKRYSSKSNPKSTDTNEVENGTGGAAGGSTSEENEHNVRENNGHNNPHIENVVNIVNCTNSEEEGSEEEEDNDGNENDSSSDSGSYYAISVERENCRSFDSVRNNQEETTVVIVRDSEESDNNEHYSDTGNNKKNKKKKMVSTSFCCSCCCCCRKKRKSINLANGKEMDRNKNTARETHRRTNRIVNCFKSFITFFFSNIGLCSLVIGYSILGGFIFQKLEAPNEENERGTVTLHRQRHVIRLWNLTEELNILHEENWSRIADEVLLDFQQEVFVAIKKQGWDGNEGRTELQWSFAGALLYSVTVITTIGYGHIAPKTAYGRIVTIFYALVGIPLTLLCLANLGSVLGTGFRCFYKHTCRFLGCRCCKTNSSRKAVRYRPNTRTTSEEVQEPLRGDTGDINTRDFDNKEHGDRTNNQKSKEQTRVPIIVSIMVIAIYICGGAIMFTLWEEDWDYLIGSYFCFITLSTIGFGDFVPGTSHDSWKNQEKLILCALYLVFGLALIAMCFNLMQEEVKAKCLWLGQRLGILETDK